VLWPQAAGLSLGVPGQSVRPFAVGRTATGDLKRFAPRSTGRSSPTSPSGRRAPSSPGLQAPGQAALKVRSLGTRPAFAARDAVRPRPSGSRSCRKKPALSLLPPGRVHHLLPTSAIVVSQLCFSPRQRTHAGRPELYEGVEYRRGENRGLITTMLTDGGADVPREGAGNEARDVIGGLLRQGLLPKCPRCSIPPSKTPRRAH